MEVPEREVISGAASENANFESLIGFLALPLFLIPKISILLVLTIWRRCGQITRRERLIEQSAVRNYPNISVRSGHINAILR